MPPGQLVWAVGHWRWAAVFGAPEVRWGVPVEDRLQPGGGIPVLTGGVARTGFPLESRPPPVGEIPVLIDRLASRRSRLRWASALGRRLEYVPSSEMPMLPELWSATCAPCTDLPLASKPGGVARLVSVCRPS